MCFIPGFIHGCFEFQNQQEPITGLDLLRGGGSSKGGRDYCRSDWGQPHQKPGKSALGTTLDWGGKKKDPFSPSRPPPLQSALSQYRLRAEVSLWHGFQDLLAFTKSFACQTNYATDKPRERLRKKAMQERKNLCSQSRKLARINLQPSYLKSKALVSTTRDHTHHAGVWENRKGFFTYNLKNDYERTLNKKELSISSLEIFQSIFV